MEKQICRTSSTTSTPPPKKAVALIRRLERRQAPSRRRRSAHRLAAEEQLSVCQGGHAARAEPRRAGAQAARAVHSEAEHAGKRAGAWARACAPNPEPPRPGVHFFLSGIRPFHHHHHPTKPERTKTPPGCKPGARTERPLPGEQASRLPRAHTHCLR